MWLLEQMIIVFTYEENMETHLRNFDSKYLCMLDVKIFFLLVFFFFLLSSSSLNHVKWTVYCLFPRAAAEFAWLELMHNIKMIIKLKICHSKYGLLMLSAFYLGSTCIN